MASPLDLIVDLVCDASPADHLSWPLLVWMVLIGVSRLRTVVFVRLLLVAELLPLSKDSDEAQYSSVEYHSEGMNLPFQPSPYPTSSTRPAH